MKYVGKKAGINKNLHPHIFRHSSVTYWHSKGLSGGVLKKRLGWKPSSDMLDRYLNISNQQQDDATLKVLGFESIEGKENFQKKACPRCGTDNEFSNYCSRVLCLYVCTHRPRFFSTTHRATGSAVWG